MRTPTKKAKLLKGTIDEILKCPHCIKSANGLIVPGEGPANAKVVLIGEAPGKQEIITGKPFIGRAGKLLRELLNSIGIPPDEAFITSAVKYLPKSYVTPKPDDIEHGRTHLFKQLDIIKPQVIILLGNVATIAVLQHKYSISSDHGKFIEKQGRIYFISYHPAAPLYDPKLRPIITADFLKLKKKLDTL